MRSGCSEQGASTRLDERDKSHGSVWWESRVCYRMRDHKGRIKQATQGSTLKLSCVVNTRRIKYHDIVLVILTQTLSAYHYSKYSRLKSASSTCSSVVSGYNLNVLTRFLLPIIHLWLEWCQSENGNHNFPLQVIQRLALPAPEFINIECIVLSEPKSGYGRHYLLWKGVQLRCLEPDGRKANKGVGMEF